MIPELSGQEKVCVYGLGLAKVLQQLLYAYPDPLTPPSLQGGLGTKEEMCLAFMSYYPRVNLSICGTQPQLKDVVGALGVEDNFDGQLKK